VSRPGRSTPARTAFWADFVVTRVGIKVVVQKSYQTMAITPSMEKVMKVNVWNLAQMHVRRAALAALAGGIVGCTAHPIPTTALDESPLAGLSAMGLNSGGTLLPNARTDGSTLLFDDPNRVIRLANFDLSDPAPRDAARPGALAAPIDTSTEFVRFHPSGSEYAVLRLP
jgi:hypothetical protein